MKKIISPLLLILLLFCSCTSNFNKKDEIILKIGNYFLTELEAGNLSVDEVYRAYHSEQEIIIDENILQSCSENDITWIAYLDENTVVLGGGGMFQSATGFIVTNGAEPKNLNKHCERFGFDSDTFKIEKKISDCLYSYSAGL